MGLTICAGKYKSRASSTASKPVQFRKLKTALLRTYADVGKNHTLRMAALTLLIGLLLLVTLAAMIVGMHLAHAWLWAWPHIHWMIAVSFAVFAVEALYFLASNVKQCFRATLPGAIQMEGREELFERERHDEPAPGWHICDLACAEND